MGMKRGAHRCASAGPRKWENRDAIPFTDIEGVRRGESRLVAEVCMMQLAGHHVDHETKVKVVLICERMSRG